MPSKVKITIDKDLCAHPKECRKCLQVCPPCVLNLTFTDGNYHNPKNWTIIPAFPQLCLGPVCGECSQVCPTNAINIIFNPS